MKTRPSLDSIGDRRAPNLHRTLPTWARQSDSEEVTWRLYVPCAEGGAYFVHVVVPATSSRSEAAKRIRAARAGLWSKSRSDADAGTPAKASTPVAAPDPVTGPKPAPSISTPAMSAMSETVSDAELEERTLPCGSHLLIQKPEVAFAEPAADKACTAPAPAAAQEFAAVPVPGAQQDSPDQLQQSLF